jgi:tetratricopeptide (TPR) repeat protein
VTLADRGYTAFKAPPPRASNGDLNQRLLSFSGNGRADLWGLAWDDAKRHSVLGSGAGTYERYFLAHQPSDVGRVRDAHGLYIETLAELGPIGLALLIAVLLTPLAALRRARRHPLVPAAAGAYLAYLVHAGVDWDWELPAVTLTGLLCGASILLFGRRWMPPRPLSLPTRMVGTAGAAAAAVFAAIALLGNSALSRSEAARGEGRPARAAADARRARSLMPWSPRPWEALGRAEVAAGLLPQARRSFGKAISMDRGDWRLWYDLAGATTGPAQHRALQHAVMLFPQSGLLPTARKTRSRP